MFIQRRARRPRLNSRDFRRGKPVPAPPARSAGSSAGTPAFHDGAELTAGVSGKLYKGPVDADVAASITPGCDGEYAILTMTGAQAKAMAEEGFDPSGSGDPFPYLLVVRGGGEPADDEELRVAFFMSGYTEEAARTYSAQVRQGSLRSFLRTWLG